MNHKYKKQLAGLIEKVEVKLHTQNKKPVPERAYQSLLEIQKLLVEFESK